MENLNIGIGENFEATPEEVFSALTDGDKILVWSGTEGYVEPRVGGHCKLFDGEMTGEVLEFNPGERLLLKINGSDALGGYKLGFNLEEVKGSTHLKVEHQQVSCNDFLNKQKLEFENKLMLPLKKFFMEE